MATFFNPNNVDTTSNFEIYPIGFYDVQITKIEQSWKEEKDAFTIRATISIISGDLEGRPIFENYNLRHPNEKAVEIGWKGLARLANALEIAHLFQGDGIDLESISQDELDQLFAYKPFTIKSRVAKGKNGYNDQNAVGEYFVHGQAPQQQPRGPAPRPQQAQNRPSQTQNRPMQSQNGQATQGAARPSQGGNSGKPWDLAAAAGR